MFLLEHTKRREPTTVLIQPLNMAAVWKEMMVSKDDTGTWEYYKHPENRYKFFNHSRLIADKKHESFNPFP